MAKIINNPLLHGISGRLGGLVFRNCHGMTVVSRLPRKSTKAPTGAQAEVRNQFRQATHRAKEILNDPGELARYQARAARKHVSPFCLVVAELVRKELTSQPMP